MSSVTDEHTVSVLIPTYYRNEYLRDAIESALGQTHESVEVIVVDDSGDAHAEPVVREYEDVEYIPFSENRGLCAAREAGVENASGEFIQFLDDDDILRAEKFEKQLPVFDAEIGVVYSGCEYEWQDDIYLLDPDPNVRGDILEDALGIYVWPLNNTTMLAKRAVIENVRPFDYRDHVEDYALRIDLATETKFDYVDEPLAYIRDTPGLMGGKGDKLDRQDGMKRIVREYAELYAEYPYVESTIKREIYKGEGKALLRNHLWSARAIKAFALAAYYDPDGQLDSYVRVPASIFGRPGQRALSTVGSIVAGNTGALAGEKQ